MFFSLVPFILTHSSSSSYKWISLYEGYSSSLTAVNVGYTNSMYEEPKINSAGNGSTFLKTQCTKISGHSSEEVAFFYAHGEQKQLSPLT